MLIAKENKMVEVPETELKVFIFRANFNPIYNIEEPETTIIEIPAPDKEYALERLKWLVGGSGRAERFTLDKIEKY